VLNSDLSNDNEHLLAVTRTENMTGAIADGRVVRRSDVVQSMAFSVANRLAPRRQSSEWRSNLVRARLLDSPSRSIVVCFWSLAVIVSLASV